MNQVTIELARIGKPARIYREGFLSDNGIELRTHTMLPVDNSRKFSSVWHTAGCFAADRFVKSVRKILFYYENFSIMQLMDDESQPLGCYVDIVTPLQKEDGIYHLTDLILDLWIRPNGEYQELDVDEFEQAVDAGKVTSAWEAQARETFLRLKTEIQAGDFPTRFTENEIKLQQDQHPEI